MGRLLFFFLILYGFYRIRRWMRRFRYPTYPNRPFGESSSAPKQIDEMKQCPSCQTYHPRSSSLEKKGLYFCGRQCVETYEKGTNS